MDHSVASVKLVTIYMWESKMHENFLTYLGHEHQGVILIEGVISQMLIIMLKFQFL
jgi:hypothetical protein